MARPTQTEQSQQEPAVDTATLRRAIGGAALGNMMEWYDYGVYAYVATTIGKVFFAGQTGALLQSFGVFALSFVLRPVGGIVFGHIGDRVGRQTALSLTIIMMAIGTFLIGVLPGYASIGIWAPIGLIVLRLIQGFSTGGEYAGAATFMAEYAPNRRRGFAGSFLPVGTLLGYSMGAAFVAALTLALPQSAMLSWGWRLPFLVGLPLGLVGLYLRLKLEDTPVYTELQGQHGTSKLPLRDVGTKERGPALLFVGVVVLLMISDYVLLSYLPTYMENVLHTSSSIALFILVGVMLVMMATVTFVGRLSDRFGRKPMLAASTICFILFSWPAFWLIQRGDLLPVVIGVLALGMFLNLFLGTEPATLPAIFSTQTRYAGFGISYNIAVAAFGGTAPLIVTALVNATGNPYMPAFYMIAAGLISLGPILIMAETARTSLRGKGRPKAVGKPSLELISE